MMSVHLIRRLLGERQPSNGDAVAVEWVLDQFSEREDQKSGGRTFICNLN